MTEYEIVEEQEVVDDSWKAKTLIIGGIVGALTGLGAAYLLTRRAEQKGEPLAISSGQGLKVSMLVAGLLRSILSLGDE